MAATLSEVSDQPHTPLPGTPSWSEILSPGGGACLRVCNHAREVMEGHRRIVDALAAADARKAADSLSSHIDRTASLSLERQWIGSQEGTT